MNRLLLLVSLKSLYVPRYQELRHRLREAREGVGITQQELAKRIERPQSFVSKYETGERWLDVIEYVDVCSALSLDAGDFLKNLLADTAFNKDASKRLHSTSRCQ